MRRASVAFVLSLTACLTEFDEGLLGGNGSGGGPHQASKSCEEVDATCNGVSCCDSLAVPGGTFSRGFDASSSAAQPGSADVTGFQDEGVAEATVSPFQLDRFEVTVQRFRHFADGYEGWRATGHPRVGDGAHPRVEGSGWDEAWPLPADTDELLTQLACGESATFDTSSDGLRPINCVSWYVGFLFCAWDGGHLPTEAEWNFAAAGGDEQRAFPWSSPPESLVIDSLHAVYGDLPIDVVGSRADLDAGRFGHHDLAGNVREWVLDSAGSLTTYPFSEGCTDCAALVDGEKIHRGGDFGADATRARTAYRSSDTRETTSGYIGIRCAR